MLPLSSPARLRLARSHRLVGLVAILPLVGWIASSFVLHGVGLALPNGLQGVYELAPHHPGGVRLEEAGVLPPGEILEALGADGMERVYWLRLEALGGTPVYVVKPGPFDLERVFDARTGARMDPLPEEMLRRIADGELTGTQSRSLSDAPEFNRYYTVERLPAVAVEMEGDQPSEVVLSRASGRVLRRTDPLAKWFHQAYLSVHVWQWGDALRLFTGVLYGLVGIALVLVALGAALWVDRRPARRRWTDQVRPARRLHARVAPVAALVLATQMLVGAYLWYNLGLIEPRFRGQGSFQEAWVGGLAVTEPLATVEDIAAALPPDALQGPQPVQRFEWRAVGGLRLWVVYPERDAEGLVLDAATASVRGPLTEEEARQAADAVVAGEPTGPGAEGTEYWMDANARVATWRFRFSDPDDSDVHVSRATGEVIQRRPAVWRAFGPFLAYHTFAFTGNPWLDTLLLTVLQVTVLVMVVTGWRMARRRD